MTSNARASARSGLKVWLLGGRLGLEGYMYLGHRVSGLILLLFVIGHVVLGASRLISVNAWMEMMQLAMSPAIQTFKYPLFIAFAFHAFNGIRLVLVELGVAVGQAEQPIYPFKGSIHKQRPLLIGMMVLTAVLLVVGELDLLRLAH